MQAQKKKNPSQVLFCSFLQQLTLVILFWSLRPKPISKLLETWWDNPDRRQHNDHRPRESHHLSASAKHTAHLGVLKLNCFGLYCAKIFLELRIVKLMTDFYTPYIHVLIFEGKSSLYSLFLFLWKFLAQLPRQCSNTYINMNKQGWTVWLRGVKRCLKHTK